MIQVQHFMCILRLHVQRTGLRWHLGADLKIIMPRVLTPRTLDLAPDLMMVKADDRAPTSWNVAEEGQVPALVLEAVTQDSWERDTIEKPLLYNAMGVQEYVIFAPLRQDDGPLLFSYHRDASGRLVPWQADDKGVLWSATLTGLGLYVEEGQWLRVYDAQQRRLPSAEEEAARAEQATATLRQAEAEIARLSALLQAQDEG